MKWGKVKVGDCCEVTSSKRIFFSEYVDSGVPFYRSKAIIESSNGKQSANLCLSAKRNTMKSKTTLACHSRVICYLLPWEPSVFRISFAKKIISISKMVI